MKPALLAAAAPLLLASAAACADRNDRLQVGIHQPETPLGFQSGEPTIVSMRWSEGDLQVLITQAAPCGNVIPVNPVWERSGTTVILHYDWLRLPPSAGPPRGELCLKHVQAWVFGVPDVPHTVLVSDYVPRFDAKADKGSAE